MPDTAQEETIIESPTEKAYKIIRKLTETRYGTPQQNAFFSDLEKTTQALIPDYNFVTALIELIGSTYIDRDVLDDRLPVIKGIIERGLQKADPSLIEMAIPTSISNNPHCFEGYPENATAAYCITLLEETFKKLPAGAAFVSTSDLLTHETKNTILKSKFDALHDETTKRFFEENPQDAIKTITLTHDPETIEKYVLPRITNNEEAGGYLALLMQAQGIQSPLLTTTFGDAAQEISDKNKEQRQEVQLTAVRLQEEIKALEKQLSAKKRALQRLSTSYTLSPTNLMTNFIAALDGKDDRNTENMSQTTQKPVGPKIV